MDNNTIKNEFLEFEKNNIENEKERIKTFLPDYYITDDNYKDIILKYDKLLNDKDSTIETVLNFINNHNVGITINKKTFLNLFINSNINFNGKIYSESDILFNSLIHKIIFNLQELITKDEINQGLNHFEKSELNDFINNNKDKCNIITLNNKQAKILINYFKNKKNTKDDNLNYFELIEELFGLEDEFINIDYYNKFNNIISKYNKDYYVTDENNKIYKKEKTNY